MSSFALQRQPSSHDVLTPLQRDVLEAFFSTTDDAAEFGLFGGTGLVEYYAGHRISEDLDLFTFEHQLIRPLGTVLPVALPELVAGITVERRRTHEMFQELQVVRGEEVLRVQLGPADPPQLQSFHAVDGVRVAALDDLAAMKCHALCDRTEPRDAVDVWALVHLLGYTVEELGGLLFGKDVGLAEHPLAWADALLRQARRDETLPSALASMLRVPLDEATLRAFLTEAGERVLEQLTRGRR